MSGILSQKKAVRLWIAGVFISTLVLGGSLWIISLPEVLSEENHAIDRVKKSLQTPLKANFWETKQVRDGFIVSYKKAAYWYVKKDKILCLTPQAKILTPQYPMLPTPTMVTPN